MDYILRYIEENLSQPLRLHEVADYAGYSTWHFCEKFKQFTGTTFTDYVRAKRMQYAVNDLLRGSRVADVAVQYGYDTVSGFHKAFFKQYGCSVEEYRQNAAFFQRRYDLERSWRLRLSDRCQLLREQVMRNVGRFEHRIGCYAYDYWKAIYALPSEKRTNYGMKAAGLRSVLEGYTPTILPNEWIVGEIFPSEATEARELNLMSYIRQKPSEAIHYLQHGPLTTQQRDQLVLWAAREDCVWPPFPGKTNVQITQRQQLQQQDGAALGNCCVDAHTVPDFQTVLEKGFDGIRQDILRARQEHPESEEFYDGCLQICESAMCFGEKYAAQARRLAAAEYSEKRRAGLETIAQVCTRVPRYPARTFHEAVQSLYFTHMMNTLEDGVNANSLGRLDQLLYPYYKRDTASGILSQEEAFELICCLWLKLYRNYDVQQCTLGGCLADGSDAVNDLSYLMLDATEELDLVRCISIRYNSVTPKAFLRRALEVLSHINKGVNAFFNDEIYIPALTNRGIRLEDARDYAVVGCAEITIPGRSNSHSATARCNMLKALEYTLTGGESLHSPGIFPGKRRKSQNYASFSALKKAVREQLEELLETATALTSQETQIRAQEWPQFYKSILTRDCLETGRSFCDRGARYDFDEVMLLGLPNLADAMMAIRRLVYEQHSLTLEELTLALRQNLSGEGGEALRRTLLYGAPKYGNGHESVDRLASELMEAACRYLQSLTPDTTDGYFAQMLSYRWSIEHGALTGASADGRLDGEPLADGVSPAGERDHSGVEALLKSIVALPAVLAPGGISATVEMDAVLVGDYHLDILTQLLIDYFGKGLGSIHLNIQDMLQLTEPELRRNLAVQVFGFRQHYEELNEEVRDFIAERTKHLTF